MSDWDESKHERKPKGSPEGGQFTKTSDGAGGEHEETPAETERLRAHVIGRKTIILSKKEYAEFCGAIRTKYADRIPRKGQILYGKYYYRFRYNKSQERLVCKFKLEIVGNESLIFELMEGR